jgi:hypothetical protein
MIDVKTIKEQIDIRALAAENVGLQRESAKEMSGPCPKCGGADRFHCAADWWFCRQCHDQRGDAIELVLFLGLASDFPSACDYLARWKGAGLARTSPATPPKKPEQKLLAPGWQSPIWQQEARAFLAAAVQRLELPEGRAAQAYLAGRGILPATWAAWSLGYAAVWHPRRKEHLPALILPWKRGHQIKALQYRFIGADITHAERFAQKAGGERTLFGVDLLAGRDALLVCEGEINAISFWQVGRHRLDVVSFGPQDNIEHAAPYLSKLASRYTQVLVWADEPAKALQALQVVGQRARAARSPRGKDANQLLQEGVLADVLENVWAKAFNPALDESASSSNYVTLIYPAYAYPVTIAGKWEHLDDGRITASYTQVELIWAMIATGYEPTSDEMALIAE